VLHVESGWVPHDIRIEEMEAAIRTICEPIFDKPLKEISFAVVLLRLFEALRRFDARIQPQLILLQKTMFNIEGLGRQLYPDLDIWKTASPILREWMREKHHPANVARRLWKQMPELLAALEASPVALRQQVVAAARPRPSWSAFAADAHRGREQEVLVPVRRTRDRTIAAALVLLGGTIWVAARGEPEWAGWLLAVIGGVWLLREVWRKR